MSKSTKITEGFYLNLKQIVTFEVISDEQIIIITNANFESASSQLIITISKKPDEQSRATDGVIYVKLQELHRIKRDVSNYLGIKEPKLKQDEDSA